jgi:hypothetical protein
VAKLWKCYHCLNEKQVPGRDFAAEKPICPNCGLDATGADPRIKHLIIPCRLVHFEPPHAIVDSIGCGKLACGKPIHNAQHTLAIKAVNCPDCIASEAGKKAAMDGGGADEFELPLEIDSVNQQYTKPK